ncbi:hypothetical protein D3C86_1805970 [compost metagenome]
MAAAVEFDAHDRLEVFSGHQQVVHVHLSITVVLPTIGALPVLEDVIEAYLGENHEVKGLCHGHECGEEAVLGREEEVWLGIHKECA